MSEIFEKASRVDLSFETTKGVLKVADLWNLPLKSETSKANLNTIAIKLYKELESSGEISFVDAVTKADEILQLKLDVVKHIIGVRKEENKAELDKKARAETKQELLSILADKEKEKLRNMSADEIKAQLEKL